jgi:CRISPR-associated protein Cas5d
MTMSDRSATFRVRARGPWACFTRPELRAERVSYEVMTPSAARGILEAVLWKPAIRWHLERIHVLAPIRFGAIKRNEVSEKLKIGGAVDAFFAEEKREQRNTLLLRDVDYVIEAHFRMTAEAGVEDSLRKFEEMFRRRLERGQCFHTPYLGCREFAAQIEPAPASWGTPDELRGTKDLGLVLLELVFADRYGHKPASPRFFPARLVDGRMDVPEVSL